MLRPMIFDDYQNAVKGYFDSFFDNFGLSLMGNVKTDIADQGDHYLLEADLPGFNKEDISLEIRDNSLVISAKQEENNEAKEDNYIRRERKMSSYTRSFDLSGIDAEHIDAKYENGVLQLKLPKLAIQPKEDVKRIEIS